MIIGFSGKIGAGKDTAGAYLVKNHGFVRISFADKLKISAAACFGLYPEIWEDLKNDDKAIIEIINGEGHAISGPTVRRFLQLYGTEAHRDVFGDDFWVDAALVDVDPTKNYVVTDVRFDNEAAAIHNLGGIVLRIERTDEAEVNHSSEAGISPALLDGKIANIGTKEVLYLLLDHLIKRVPAVYG